MKAKVGILMIAVGLVLDILLSVIGHEILGMLLAIFITMPGTIILSVSIIERKKNKDTQRTKATIRERLRSEDAATYKWKNN